MAITNGTHAFHFGNEITAATNNSSKLKALHSNCHCGGRGAPQAHLKAGGSNRSIRKCGIAKLTNAINATHGPIDRILLNQVLNQSPTIHMIGSCLGSVSSLRTTQGVTEIDRDDERLLALVEKE